MTSPQRELVDVRESRDLRVCMQCQDKPSPTEYICGDCALALCATCKYTHIAVTRFSGHTIVPYIETNRCAQHGKRQILRCADCNVECCIVCANFGQHRGHRVEDKNAELMARQAALERECEAARKRVEGKLQGQLALLQRYEGEVNEVEEAALKAFTSHVSEQRSQLKDLLTQLKAKFEQVKAPCDSKSLEDLQILKSQLQALNSAESYQLPSPQSFKFSHSFQAMLPITSRYSPSPHIEFLPSQSESPRNHSAMVYSAEFAYEESNFLEDDSKAEAEDLRYPIEPETRNPTIAPQTRPMAYSPLNDEVALLCLDLISEECKITPTARVWPKFCSLTLLGPELALITGGGERPCRAVSSLNLRDFTCTELSEMHTARNYHSSVFVQGQVLVLGGFNQIIQHSCEAYSPSDDQWTDVSPLNIARGAMGACLHEDAVYSIGGWDGHQEVRSIERLIQLNSHWELLSFSLPQPSQCNAIPWDSFILVFAYQAERVYLIEQSEVLEYGPLPNEAWARPELVRYQDLVYGFKSDCSKVLFYDVRRKKYRSVAIERRLGTQRS